MDRNRKSDQTNIKQLESHPLTSPKKIDSLLKECRQFHRTQERLNVIGTKI